MSTSFEKVAKAYARKKLGRRRGNREIDSVDFEINSFMDGCCEECMYPTTEIEASVRFTDGTREKFEVGSSWGLNEFLRELVES